MFSLVIIVVCSSCAGSTVIDVEDKDIEVDESLFQDLEDLELEDQT